MKVRHSHIDFRISRRTLWVGSKAYPLHMITLVEPLEITPNRGRMIGAFAKRASATGGLGIVGAVILSCAGTSVSPTVWGILALVVCGLLVAHIVKLAKGLGLANLYILKIRTAGTAHAALVSTDQKLIFELTHRVVDAIDNPKAEFEIRVDHLDIVHGDKIFGDQVYGDKVYGDKVLEGWGS